MSLVKQDSNGFSGAAYSRSQENGSTWNRFTLFSNPADTTYAFGVTRVLDQSTMLGLGYGPDGATLWDSMDDGTPGLSCRPSHNPTKRR